jgi:DNA-directed RNA polymerase subunit RPC12/RpoP
MTKGYCCDRCGAAIFEGENVTLTIGLYSEEQSDGDDGLILATPRSDLCAKCAQAVEGIIKTRIITSKTNLDVWRP